MRSKLAIFCLATLISTYAFTSEVGENRLDQMTENFISNSSYLANKICNGPETLKQCDLYTQDDARKLCISKQYKACNNSFDKLVKAQGLSLYKPIVDSIETVYDIKILNGAKFNKDYVSDCKEKFGKLKNSEQYKECIKVIADNEIAPKLFKFCNFNITCLSRLRHIKKVGPWIGESNFNACRRAHTGFGLIECARNTVETKGITAFVRKVGELEYKLNECQQSKTGISVESDMQKLNNEIKNSLYSDTHFSSSTKE